MKSKLLLVEDEEHTREAVAEYLSEMGYSVICAEDGQQGIELFHEHTFDLIILDIMLPKANGFIVLNEIRKKSQVPVLMLTAMSDEYTQIVRKYQADHTSGNYGSPFSWFDVVWDACSIPILYIMQKSIYITLDVL